MTNAIRYIKIGSDGQHLADDATSWAAVLDTRTNLFWTVEESPEMSQPKCAEFAAALSTAGFTDWRLPTLDELETLRDIERYAPAINTAYFPNCQSDWYWTSREQRRRRATARGSSASTAAARTGTARITAVSSARFAPVSNWSFWRRPPLSNTRRKFHMSSLAVDVRNLIIGRLAELPIKDLLDFASTGLATSAEASSNLLSKLVKPEGFVKIGSRGEVLGEHATDWVAVRDLRTDLIWSRHTVNSSRLELAPAKDAASKVELCGWKDWRLPTRAELLSLVDDTRHSPAINTDFFDCKSDWYWTSTPLASSPGGYAWVVYFSYGNALWSYQDGSGFVRAVRASQ